MKWRGPDGGKWENLRHEVQEELLAQKPVWSFVFRTVAACFLAMAAAMHFHLDQPATSVLTVLIVMQPHSGAVLAKSAFRIIGTLAGCSAVLALFALFPQQRILLLLGLALWVGLCTAGAARLRNFQSYGFVLAGYTACIVGFPASENPQAIFAIATARVSEVLLGILCSAVMVEAAFSHRSQKDLLALSSQYFLQFGQFILATLTKRDAHEDVRAHYLRLIAGVSRLEMHSANAFFEAQESRVQYGALHSFTVNLMAASSSFRAFYHCLERLRRVEHHPAVASVDALLVHLAGVLNIGGQPARSPGQALHLARHLHDERSHLNERLLTFRSTHSFDERQALDFDSLSSLLRIFLHDMHACMLSYAAITSPRHATLLERVRFVPKTDILTALAAGLRAVVALLVVASFWIVSGWPSGGTATTFAAVLCALFASSPSPTRAVWNMGKGALLGAVSAVVCAFFILPLLDGFLLLCAGLLPFLMVGPWLASKPATAGMGGGYNIMLTGLIGPALVAQIIPDAVFNSVLARLFAMGVAGAIFATLLPSGGMWWKQRLLTGLCHSAVKAVTSRVATALERFESGTHDIVLQFTSNAATTPQEHAVMLEWAFIVSEIGRVTIALRRELRYFPLSPSLAADVRHVVGAITALFTAPDRERYECALSRLDTAIETLSTEMDTIEKDTRQHPRLRHMRALLHTARLTLIDTDRVWTRPRSIAFLPAPEVAHAA